MGMANIFIYGSCIGRDSFEALSGTHTLVGYVARQTVISAMSRSTEMLQGSDLRSNWQTRMLNGDLASNLRGQLRHHTSNIDLLLMDMADERLGVHKLLDGSFVSRSHELVSSGRLGNLTPIPGTIQMGTARHWEFWKRAANKYAQLLDDLGLKQKALVVHTPWTSRSTCGSEVPLYRHFTSEAMNEHLQACSDHYRGLGLQVVEMPEDLAVTTSSHERGIAQYHYDKPAHEWIVNEIEKKLRYQSVFGKNGVST